MTLRQNINITQTAYALGFKERVSIYNRLEKGWSLEEALTPKGSHRKIDIQKRISKYDKRIEYIDGYVNCYSTITCKCKVCGNTFKIQYKKLTDYYKRFDNYCACDNCRNNVDWHNSKSKRLKGKVIDKDITLKKLYQRDNGICYLCGGKCDYNDYKIVDGKKRYFRNYPSIDHITPLSKGGVHSWQNVKLAHIGCNASKCAKILE